MRSPFKLELPKGARGLVTGLFIGLFVLSAAPLAAAVVMLSPFPSRAPGNSSLQLQSAPVRRAASPAPAFVTLSEPMNVLFLGTDVVYSRTKRADIADQASYRGNSDTMMLIRLDPVHTAINVIQIPRDTRVHIEGYGTHKINAANPLGGPALAEQTVSSFLNEPVDHFLVMNVRGIVDVVNELGGITVNVPKPMKYMDWTGKLKIDLKPGWHTLTGNQSMGFVRFRHDALGDIGRVERQQLFMDALLRKVVNPLYWPHVPALIGLAQKNIQTDLGPAQIVRIANFVHSVPRKDIHFLMLPGRFAGNGDWLVDPNDAQSVVARLEGGMVEHDFQDEQATTSTNQDPALGAGGPVN